MKILDACEQSGERFTAAITPQLEECREVAKHLLTLASTTLVLTITLATAAWSMTKTVPEVASLLRIWGGLGMSLLLTLMCVWHHVGVRSYSVNVWNQLEALDKRLNDGAISSPLSEAPASTRSSTLMISRSDRSARMCLRFGFVCFAYAFIELVSYGFRVFH